MQLKISSALEVIKYTTEEFTLKGEKKELRKLKGIASATSDKMKTANIAQNLMVKALISFFNWFFIILADSTGFSTVYSW